MDSESKIRELEAKLAALTAEVEHLRAVPAGSAAAAPGSSRRGVLKLAGAAAAGAAATMLGHAGQAAAIDGDAVTVGQIKSSTGNSREPSILVYPNTLGPEVTLPSASKASANIFLVRDDPTSPDSSHNASPTFPSAVAGYAFRAVANGLYGYTQNTGYGVVGRGAGSASIGVYAQGAKANLELKPAGEVPSKRIDAHTVGEIIVDASNDLWFCTVSGTPGTWRKLTGSSAAGAFHALAPARVYDSRAAAPSPGTLSQGASRTVSVASKRDTTTGAVTTADIVPAGATAIACNVTVVNTVAGGFLTVNPGGTVTTDGATVNWSGAGQILNNGVIVKLNDSRQVTVVCGGTTATRTDVVIDVTGYFL